MRSALRGDPYAQDLRQAPAAAYEDDDDYALPQRVPAPGFDGRPLQRFGSSPRVAPVPPSQRAEQPPTRREELLRQPPPMKPLPYYAPPPPPPAPPRSPSPTRPKRGSSMDAAKRAMRALSMVRPQKHRLISKGMLLPMSRFMLRWNISLIVMLAYTALLTPYEVAFLDSGRNDIIWYFDRFVDFFFLLDIFINFNLCYYDEERKRYVQSRSQVALRYLCTYFVFDLVSIVPFDYVIAYASGAGEPSGSSTQMSLLRITRLVRLTKLLRIIRLARLFDRFEDAFNVRYGVIKLWKFFLWTVLTSHWLACIYVLVAMLNPSECNWINHYFTGGYVINNVLADGCVAIPAEYEVFNFHKYTAALYWSVMTVATVGYGDVPPQNEWERLFLIFAMYIGAGVFAFVLGNVCDVVASLNMRDNDFETLMDTANMFVADTGLSEELAGRVRSFLRNRRLTSASPEWQRLMGHLSPQIRNDIALFINAKEIELVGFFKGVSKQCLSQVALVLRSEMYPPFELVLRADQKPDRMYIIQHGLMAVNSYIRTRGSCVGEDMVFKSHQYGYAAATMSFCELLVLTKEDFVRVLTEFPSESALVRRKAIRMIFREQVIAFAVIARKAARLQLRIAADVAARSRHQARQRQRAAARAGSGPVAAESRRLTLGDVAGSALTQEIHDMLVAVKQLEYSSAFPVLLLLVTLSNPSYEATLNRLATKLQRAWRRIIAARADAVARAAAIAAERAAVEAERQRDRDAAPGMGVLDGSERVVVVYGPAPLAAEQLRQSVDALRAQVAALTQLVTAARGNARGGSLALAAQAHPQRAAGIVSRISLPGASTSGGTGQAQNPQRGNGPGAAEHPGRPAPQLPPQLHGTLPTPSARMRTSGLGVTTNMGRPPGSVSPPGHATQRPQNTMQRHVTAPVAALPPQQPVPPLRSVSGPP